MSIWAALIAIHLLGAIIWVGGMIFVLRVLHPAALPLAPAERVSLMSGVFSRFFRLVWVSIAALLLTGYGLVFGLFGGFATAPIYVHIMQGLGLLMTALFAWLYFMPYQAFRFAATGNDLPAAARAAARIRHLVLINLVFGTTAAILGAAGRFVAS